MDNKKTAVLGLFLGSLTFVNGFLSLIVMVISFVLFTLISNSLSGYAGIIILVTATLILGLGLGRLSYYSGKKFSDNDMTRFFTAFFTSLLPAGIISYFLNMTRIASSMSSSLCSLMPSGINTPISINCPGQAIDLRLGMIIFIALFYLPLLIHFYRKKERNNKALIWFITSIISCIIAIPWIFDEAFKQALTL